MRSSVLDGKKGAKKVHFRIYWIGDAPENKNKNINADKDKEYTESAAFGSRNNWIQDGARDNRRAVTVTVRDHLSFVPKRGIFSKLSLIYQNYYQKF